MKWVKVTDCLPEIKDDSVIAFFGNTGSIETVHIEEYFKPITSGLDDKGSQKYTLWAYHQNVTHWMPLPEPPEDL